ncbi:MAG: RNA methyltransferase [Dissulfurimicrobium sp.]|uniref:RNA methyltransferase n=1 Tax=Dissulfurimicrobium TaxID=1769732 RepID=UPI001EDAA714|nr:RNA methyltransferase [Dissulfurimicrobium hydrothermale]UKL13437.1 RNA methyltransferase [Dissulfurimicrobium hydrothermale]
MENIGVVLVEPKYPENIGAAARCCKNMGIWRLVLVRPHDLNREKMLKMATHEAAEIIYGMSVHDSLEEALSSFNYAVGSTARTGRRRRPTDTPREMAASVAALSHTNKVALVFGSEKWGLTNEDLCLCQSIVTIPTAGFSSINLAQSVMILCYEIFAADIQEPGFKPRLASLKELEAMYEHLKEAFLAIGLIDPKNPDYWIRNVRRLFARVELRSREVRLVRGLCRQILWATGRNRT